MHHDFDLVYLMGVSGCGKSTLGRMLAEEGYIFIEGDDFHTPESKHKMSQGIPLTDEDRWPWLDRIKNRAKRELEKESLPVLVSCSALKRRYRDYLTEGFEKAGFFFLKGSQAQLQEHLEIRDHEFMSPALLESQLETLEIPQPDEPCIVLEIEKGPAAVFQEALEMLNRVGS